MIRRAPILLAVLLLAAAALALAASPALADFGFLPGAAGLDGSLTNQDGSPDVQAGSHPYAFTTSLDFTVATNSQGEPLLNSEGFPIPSGGPKDLRVSLPPGLIGDPGATPKCPAEQLEDVDTCSLASQVGIVDLHLTYENFHEPVYNVVPPVGEPAEIGFNVLGVAIFVPTGLRTAPEYGLTSNQHDISEALPVIGASLTLWGLPASPAHDSERGISDYGVCERISALHGIGTFGDCPSSAPLRPFLTLPTSCDGPMTTSALADSWQNPGADLSNGEPDLADPNWASASYQSHDAEGNPIGLQGCNRLAFSPQIQATPTTDAATSPTGLEFDLNVDDEGLANPEGLAQSQIKKAVVTLPEGMSTNPSVAEGLHACTEAAYESETLSSEPGTGCPDEAKIGDVEIESPLVEQKVDGSLYIAKQDENPFHSLLALYIVAKNQELGVMVKAAGKVESDPVSGQLTTTFDNLPQLPFSHFHLSFRQGQRSPLVSPPACGTYAVKADLYPWSEPEVPLHDSSAFQITTGPEGQGCPSGGVPPFHPEVSAGTLNNNAGSYSPFYLRMTRKDSEQEITHFSSQLPPGLVGKLAGVAKCPDAAIEAAKSKTGAEEQESPSCPASSEIGHTLVGAGVGSVLAYAPGKVYLAGPYHGSPLSIAAITAARVGPFDLGTVVVRSALRIDPETARVSVDSQGSDPIPHIIDGIPVHLRDIRVYVDRPEFTLNPTSCNPFQIASTLTGSGQDFASSADDVPATVEDRFQAANCANLGFAPKLSFKLKGGTTRGAHPALTATLKAPPGEANIAAAAVTLPHSEFLDQAHIKEVCTRVQFNQGAGNGAGCPAASIYGHARAITPLLSEPIEGPVYLRSNGGERKLPDLVAALHSGEINVDLLGFIDSVNGGIRNRFEAVPDAPVSEFTLALAGGKKGLLVNSENLCSPNAKTKAIADFTAQNGKLYDTTPAVANSCPRKGRGKRHGHKHGGKK